MHIYINKRTHTLCTLFFTDLQELIPFPLNKAQKHAHESVSTELCHNHLTEVSIFQQGNTLQLPTN